jgi:capsular polysaccharide biosynthesis protein
MELRRYLSILRKRLWLIVAAVVVAAGVTALTVDSVSTYTATATIYVGADVFLPGNADSNRTFSNDVQTGLTQLIRTFAVMIDSTPIADDAVAATGVSRSAASVVRAAEAAAIPGTNLLVVTVTDTDPLVAQELTNGMAEAFEAQIAEIEPGQTFGEGDVPRAPARIFERAQLPTTPTTESVTANIVIAALVALVASTGLVLLAEYLDVTVRSPEEAEARLELPVLGVVPMIPEQGGPLRRPSAPAVGQIGLVADA